MTGQQTSPNDADTRRQEQPPSLGDLFRELRRDVETLVRQELALAKLEVSGNLRRLGLHAALAAAGVLAACAGVLLLLLAVAALVAWACLGLGASPPAAIVLGLGIAGMGVSGTGALLLSYGGGKLREQSALPKATLENLKEDVRCIRRGLK